MKTFSKTWISSTKIKKQRKYRANAPLHIKGKFLSAHLSKELKQKYGKRSLRIRKGDKVKIAVGTHKNKSGTVEKVDIKHTKIYISGVETVKKDGSKTLYPIQPSNVTITELNLSDKARKQRLEAMKKSQKQKE